MDIVQSYSDRNMARKITDNRYTQYLQKTSPIPIDAGYIVKNNIQDVPNTEELTEAELINMDNDRGKLWSAASKVVYDAMYDGVNAITLKKPENDQDYGRFGVEFMGQFDNNLAMMGYNVAKLQNVDERTKLAMYHLMTDFGKLPDFTWNGAQRFIKGIFTDPTTYASVGSIGLGFLGRAGVKQATKEGFKQILRKGLTSPYAVAALEGGGYGGLYDYFTQEVGIEAGVQDGVNLGQLAGAAGIGTVAGPAIVKGGQLIGKAAKAGIERAAPVVRDLFDQATPAPTAANDPVLVEANIAKFEPPTDEAPGIVAFHGSGADFDEFKLEKIGTGEGAQAYGYGLYFAENEDIAAFYKSSVANKDNTTLRLDGNPVDSVYTQDNIDAHGDFLQNNFAPEEYDDALLVLDNLGQGIDNLTDADAVAESSFNLRQFSIYERIRDMLTEPEIKEGKMYKVGIQPKPEDMMDYQLPLADQDEKFLAAFKNIYHDRIKADPDLAALYPTPDSLTMSDMGLLDKSVAGQVYRTFSSEFFNGDDAALSAALFDQGVPGIKYRDAGSRGGSKSLADAKFNFVVFDDKAIKILAKYGVVGPVAVTALASQKSQDNDEGVANAPKI